MFSDPESDYMIILFDMAIIHLLQREGGVGIYCKLITD